MRSRFTLASSCWRYPCRELLRRRWRARPPGEPGGWRRHGRNPRELRRWRLRLPAASGSRWLYGNEACPDALASTRPSYRATATPEFCPDLVIAEGSGTLFGLAGDTGVAFEGKLGCGLDCETGEFRATAPDGGLTSVLEAAGESPQRPAHAGSSCRMGVPGSTSAPSSTSRRTTRARSGRESPP